MGPEKFVPTLDIDKLVKELRTPVVTKVKSKLVPIHGRKPKPIKDTKNAS